MVNPATHTLSGPCHVWFSPVISSRHIPLCMSNLRQNVHCVRSVPFPMKRLRNLWKSHHTSLPKAKGLKGPVQPHMFGGLTWPNRAEQSHQFEARDFKKPMISKAKNTNQQENTGPARFCSAFGGMFSTTKSEGTCRWKGSVTQWTCFTLRIHRLLALLLLTSIPLGSTQKFQLERWQCPVGAHCQL